VRPQAIRPLLLIDVDGVISLFGFDPARPPAGRFQLVDGIAHYISSTAGPCLRELGADFELTWCSGWEEKANDYLPLALDLPGPLALIAFDRFERPAAAHWKLAGIDAHASPTTPLAWIDDALDERCARWAQARPAPTLLLSTERAVGLTGEHVKRLRRWAHRLP
jgi:hypothetical protein